MIEEGSTATNHNDNCAQEPCFVQTGNDQLSPESVEVRVEEPRKNCPKGSTAAAYHGVGQEALTFYEKLIVIHHNISLRLHFNLRQRSHCALVSPGFLICYAGFCFVYESW